MSANDITDILLEILKEDSTEYKTLETDDYDLAEKKNAIISCRKSECNTADNMKNQLEQRR